MRYKKHIILFIFFILIISGAHAKVTPEEAKQLRSNLTPMGATRASNKNGNILEWKTDQLSDKDHLQWRKAIQKEKALFIINTDNAPTYAHLLSEGLLAMLKHYPETFEIPAYQTHRTSRYPKWVNDNTYKNATDAATDKNAHNMLTAWPGIPFPIPNNAQEIIWNHKLRWVGHSIEFTMIDTLVDSSGIHTPITTFFGILDAYHDLEGKRYYTQHIDHSTLILNKKLSAKKDFNARKVNKTSSFRRQRKYS